MSAFGPCPGCGKSLPLMPLHGDKGGPLRCSFCAGKWHAKHTRRRRAGRVVIKAMNLYLREDGNWTDLDKFKLFAGGDTFGLAKSFLGFEPDTIGSEVGDITSELLADTLELTHPDRHPPERRELATRVTQELLALKPFVFPAPKEEPVTAPKPRDDSFKSALENLKKPSRPTYPCEDCADTVPYYYCDPCRAEYDKRHREKREREKAKQREQYARRRERQRQYQRPVMCAGCGGEFKPNRKGTKHCSAACRQRAHRERNGSFQSQLATNKQPLRSAS